MRKNIFVSFVLILSLVLSMGFYAKPANAQTVCDGAPAIGQHIQVTATSLNVRSEARVAASTRIGSQSFGATGVVTGGAVTGSGYCWVSINYTTGADGFSATDSLEVIASTGGYPTVPTPPYVPPSFPPGCTATTAFSATTGQPCSGGSSSTSVPGGGTIATQTTSPSFGISSTGENSIGITPVYIAGTSYDNSGTQAAVNAMVSYWNGQAAGTTFHLTANIDSPMPISALVHQAVSSCTTAETNPPNTMFLFIGNSTGGVSCTNDSPYLVLTPSGEILAHEFGHLLGLDHGFGIMASSTAFFAPLNAAQKTALGWATSSAGAPTTPPADGGAHVGNYIDVGGFGQMALVCPAETIVTAQNSVANISVSKAGASLAVMSAEIPSRAGPMYAHDVGVRGRPTSGFSPGSPASVTIGQYSSFATLPVTVTASPGFYNIAVEGRINFVVPDFTGDHEQDMVAGFTTCQTSIQVLPAGSSPSAFGRINGILGAGDVVHQMSLQAGSTAQVQFSSAGVTACYVYVNGQLRPTLASGRTEGSFTSDAAISGVGTVYTIRCQIAGAPPGTLTEITADSTLTIASGLAPGPGGIVANIQMRSVELLESGGTQPRLDIGAVYDTVSHEMVNQINVPAGTSVRVYFDSTNATSCTLNPFGVSGTIGNTTVGNVQSGVNMTLTCRNASGEYTKRARINVEGIISTPPSSYETVSCFPSGVTVLTQEDSTAAGGGLNTDFVIQPFPVVVDVHSASAGSVNFSSIWTDFTGVNESNGAYMVSSGSGSLGTNTLLFKPRPVRTGTAHPISSGSLTITAKSSSGNSIGNCVVSIYLSPVSRNTPGSMNIHVDPNPLSINLNSTGTITLSGGHAPYSFTSVSNGQVIRNNYPIGFGVEKIVAQIQGDKIIINSIGSTPGPVLFEVGDSDPAGASGYRWTQVGVNVVGTAGATTSPTSSTPGIGTTASVTTSGGPINVRSIPSTKGTVVSTQPFGATATVLSAPVNADGYTWVKASFTKSTSNANASGYVATKYLKTAGGVNVGGCTGSSCFTTIPVVPPAPTPTSGPVIGCTASFVYSPITGQPCKTN